MNEEEKCPVAPSIGKIATAMAMIQAEIQNPKFDSRAKVVAKSGAKYEYEYTSLATILEIARPICAKHKVAIVQLVEPTVLTTMLVHESGELFKSTWLLPSAITPQEYGSWISYGRRYTLAPMLGIASEKDDDGAAAQDGGAKVPDKDAIRGELVELMSTAMIGNKMLGDYCRAKGLGDFKNLADFSDTVVAQLVESWPQVVAAVKASKMPAAGTTAPPAAEKPKPEGKVVDFAAKLAEEKARKAEEDAKAAELSPAKEAKAEEAKAEPPPHRESTEASTAEMQWPPNEELCKRMRDAAITPRQLFDFYVRRKHHKADVTPDKLPALYIAQILKPQNWAKASSEIKLGA